MKTTMMLAEQLGEDLKGLMDIAVGNPAVALETMSIEEIKAMRAFQTTVKTFTELQKRQASDMIRLEVKLDLLLNKLNEVEA